MEKLNDIDVYLPKNKFLRLFKIISKHPDYIIYKVIKNSRKYKICKEKNNKLGILFYGIKTNRLASKYNLELYGKFGNVLKIWHKNVIINNDAVIGSNVQFYGNNCVGKKGDGKAPIIGNNVDIGYGTTIMGNIKIANNIVIGANSLVNKSFLEEGVVIAGCPAKVIRKKT